jgi:hypothetical protein
MNSRRRIGIVVVLVIASCASAIAWHTYRAKARSQEANNEMIETRALAEEGDAGAEYRLGSMYGVGRGVTKDYAAALHWYRAAAEKGDARAEYGVGYMYDTGTGVQQDFSEALSWYQKAANQNDRKAQCALAAMYYDGRGVERDWTAAASWYQRAAENGLPRAQYDLGYMYYYGQGLKQDRALAMQWFREALKQGDEHAREWLGYKLTTVRIVFLVFQTLFGVALAFRPWSFNIWEPSESPRDFVTWFSVAVGWACVIDAAMGWWGYTHNLFWSHAYGVTGFILAKSMLNIVVMVLILLSAFLQGKAASERKSTVTSE